MLQRFMGAAALATRPETGFGKRAGIGITGLNSCSVSPAIRNRSEMRELRHHPSLHLSTVWDRGEAPIRQAFRARTAEELTGLLSAVATAILAVIIIMMLFFGREIIIPIALAILLSFVLAPVVGLLQSIQFHAG